MEHLHPLDLVLEVCHVLPASICQMLSLKISFITFKRAGAPLSFDLWVQGLRGLGFIYDPFLQSYIPPLVKEDPYAHETFPIQEKVQTFVESKKSLLLIAATAGVCRARTRMGAAYGGPVGRRGPARAAVRSATGPSGPACGWCIWSHSGASSTGSTASAS